jgi:polyvinyl alcohol dehydrogenase (cytochrome)
MSSYEESQGADPQYGCCTFRGSVSALDAGSGAVVWRTALITDPLTSRGRSTAGVELWGPSGSAVWSPPTIDATRRLVYVATGNGYSGPPHPSSNAVVALDLANGAVRWTRQVTPGDVYVSNCRAGNPNCPDVNGPDVDFGSPPMLARTAAGRDLIVIGQKSGVGYALDPTRTARSCGSTARGAAACWAASSGARRWTASARTSPCPTSPRRSRAVCMPSRSNGAARVDRRRPAVVCAAGRGCTRHSPRRSRSFPASCSRDRSTARFAPTRRDRPGALVVRHEPDFTAVNGVPANGRVDRRAGPAVAGGMLFVNSGYGRFSGGRATCCWPSG